jgi:hypothetical protein
MGLIKFLFVLICLHAPMVHATRMLKGPMTLQDILTSTHPSVTGLLESVGGGEEFEVELRNIVNKAMLLRQGLPASVVDFKIGRKIIAKVCFTDGVCWAAKLTKMAQMVFAESIYAIKALNLLHEYCPNIPTPKLRGYGNRKIFYYFTDWIEGNTLHDEVLKDPVNFSAVKLPERIITSLAEFVYNLTTCPIPENECISISHH